MIRAGFCLGRENVVYLYAQLVRGAANANAGNSMVLYTAHMSGALLLGPFDPETQLRRSHFHVWMHCCPLK